MDTSLEHRVSTLENTVSGLEGRLRRAEAALGLAERAVAPPAPPSTHPPVPPRLPRRQPGPGLEDLFGGRVLAWLGGSAIVLGVAFFLVMAVHRGWIDEPTRVVLAFLGSSALLGAGLWLHERRGQTQAALAAVASAVASFYLSLTAATQLYHLVAPGAAFAIAALIGPAATAIAVRWDSRVVAGIGIVGALLAPVLVDAGTSGGSLAFTALALCSAAGVLLWRRWDWLAAAAFAVSAPQLVAWAADAYRERLGLTLGVLGLFWLLNVVAGIGYELRVPTARLRTSSALLLFANVATIAGAGFWLLSDLGKDEGATAWVLALALVHVLLGAATRVHRRVSPEIGALLVGLGVALSAIGFALALDGPALVVGWAAQAVLLAWLGTRFGDWRAAVGALAFLGLAGGHALAFEAPPDALVGGAPDLAAAAVALTVVALASLIVARLLPAGDQGWRRGLEEVGAVTLLYLFSVGIVDLWGVAADGTARQEGQVGLSAFWSLTGLAGLVFGLVRDAGRVRHAGLALLAVAAVKVFLYDLAALSSIFRVLSLIALGLLLLAGAFAYQRARLDGKDAS